MGVRNGDYAHPRRKTCGNAGFRIFDYPAVFWRDAEQFSRAKKNIRAGLPRFMSEAVTVAEKKRRKS
jgi:hypothetical protein